MAFLRHLDPGGGAEVARQTHNLKVIGSNPFCRTKLFEKNSHFFSSHFIFAMGNFLY